MAQSKPSPSSGSGRPSSNKSGKPTGRPSSRPTSSSSRSSSSRPPTNRKPGKSIVNQKQTPWGLIITTAIIVLFAAGVVIAVVATHKSTPQANGGCNEMIGNNKTSYLNENKCASEIQGVTFHEEAHRQHVQGHITYNTTPPVGGNHSQYWADCTGTVYPNAIANENAVHMLEHGAIWITYNKSTLPASQLKILENDVSGVDRMALSPFPNLKTPISLQAWGYQLFVNSATDPRIQQFITDLKYNPETTPEYGASCSQPTFIAHPSTFGHPLWVPYSGASGNTGGA